MKNADTVACFARAEGGGVVKRRWPGVNLGRLVCARGDGAVTDTSDVAGVLA